MGKEEVKGFLIVAGMKLNIKKTKDTTKRSLELIRDFGNTARYKVNTQKSITFIYINKITLRNNL